MRNLNRDSKISVYLIAFLVVTFISSIFGVDFEKSLIGNYYRLDGLNTIFSLGIFALIISHFWNSRFEKPIALTFYFSSLVLSVLTLLNIANASTFGNPVFLAGFLAVSLPFSFYYAKIQNKYWFYLVPVLQMIAAINIGAISAILTVFVNVLILAHFYLSGKAKYLTFALFGFVGLLISYFWTTDYYLKNSQSLVAEGRVRIFVNGFEGFLKRPILGYGWSNFDYSFEKGNWPIKLTNDVYVDKAHSEIFEILVTTGIVGLLIYMSFLVLIYKKAIRTKGDDFKIAILSVLILYLFHSQTNVISIAEQMLFWLVVGITI